MLCVMKMNHSFLNIKPFVILTLSLLFPFASFANDSASELSAGGIVLIKNDAISMQREDLFLSPASIRVRYEMYNHTNEPVTLRVAFPMPEVPTATLAGFTTSRGERNIAISEIKDINFIDFRVAANGKNIVPDVEIKSILKGKDITASLREIGGPSLLLRSGELMADEKPLPDDVIQKLKAIGAYEKIDEIVYKLPWTTFITFYWMQTFQPGITVIEHQYKPIVGSRLIYASAKKGIQSSGGNVSTDFCIDAATEKAIRRLTKGAGEAEPLFGQTLGYIVRTAQNWKDATIGAFHVTIEGAPSTKITSLCSQLKLQKTGKNRFEASVQNYRNFEDFRVLFINSPGIENR